MEVREVHNTVVEVANGEMR